MTHRNRELFPYCRAWGFGVVNVLAAEVVLADGSIIQVRRRTWPSGDVSSAADVINSPAVLLSRPLENLCAAGKCGYVA